MTASLIPSPRPRFIGFVNWLGLGTLIAKEIERFLGVYTTTILAPVVTTLLYFTVFAFAFGGSLRSVGAVPFLAFLAPGLVMMSMAQNAFINTSSSLVISKIQGNIVDVLMPPLSSFELMAGYALGGLARGLVVGAVSVACLAFLAPMAVHSLFFILYHAIMGSMMLALVGIMGGLWSEKWDHLAAVQNFIVLPATFLSGTFYSINLLPQSWQFLCRLNPFFYMIDGFRFGFIGVADGNLLIGLLVMFEINLVLLWAAHSLIAGGYKLKA
ncbi:MAG: ABC transporter permease [Alphaproteobacteria bacterium]|nr:ABC transporter permease [Alphaproteobacteria bacterium]